MSPPILTEQLLQLLTPSQRIYILYGQRGGGKTLFLLQLLAALLTREQNTGYLGLVDRHRDRSLFQEVVHRQPEALDQCKYKFHPEDQLLATRIEFLSFVLYELFQPHTSSPTIVIDELFPVTMLSQELAKLSQQIPLLFVLLLKCASKSKRIICTVPELPSFLPLYWQALIELNPIFLRLRRGRRRRDLFQVTFQQLPGPGNKWTLQGKDDINVASQYIASFRVTEDQLFTPINVH